jgi:hypothetical protein
MSPNSRSAWTTTKSVGPMSDVESLVRQVLVEGGYPPVDLQRTPWAVAKDVAQGIVDARCPSARAVTSYSLSSEADG